MNNEQIKQKLYQLYPEIEDFQVILSGKASKKVNGLYKPESKEIILHNKNFSNPNEMMYTAIHEFAHHIHFCTSHKPISSKAHTIEFRNIFHKLLISAEKKGHYNNLFKTNQEFIRLTKDIKENFLAKNGQLMIDFSQKLIEAVQLCLKHQVRFEDYLERELLLHASQAKAIVELARTQLPVSLGFDNMKVLAKLEPEKQKDALDFIQSGASIDMVKAEFGKSKNDEQTTPLEKMRKEKERLKKQIKKLQERLRELEEKMDQGISRPDDIEIADQIERLFLLLEHF